MINNTLYNNNITFGTQTITYRNVLRNSLTQIHYLIIETRNKLNNLTPFLRNKRGLIDIVGKTLKFLFGTMDSEDAANYDKAIKILNDNQNSIKKQTQIQISLTQKLIDNYNHTITILDKNQQLIEKRLNHFEDNVYKNFDDISTFIRAQNRPNNFKLPKFNFIFRQFRRFNSIRKIENTSQFSNLSI